MTTKLTSKIIDGIDAKTLVPSINTMIKPYGVRLRSKKHGDYSTKVWAEEDDNSRSVWVIAAAKLLHMAMKGTSHVEITRAWKSLGFALKMLDRDNRLPATDEEEEST